jgi:hypothetical protein
MTRPPPGLVGRGVADGTGPARGDSSHRPGPALIQQGELARQTSQRLVLR